MTGNAGASQHPIGGCARARETSGQLLVDESCELRFAESAHFGGSQLAIFEDHQSGDAANAIFGRNVAIFIHVHFGNLQLTFVACSHFVQNGGNHFAGATPLSPKVDNDWLARLQDIGLKGGVGGVFDQIAGHGRILVMFNLQLKGVCKVSLF